MAKTNQVFGAGILVEKKIKDLKNAKGTHVVSFFVNTAVPGAKEKLFEVKAIRNNKDAAEKILADAPAEKTKVRIWGSLNTYRKEGTTTIRVSAMGGIQQETSADKPSFTSYALEGLVTKYDEEDDRISVTIDSSYMKGETKVQREDEVELVWVDEDNAFDEELVGKVVTFRGNAKEMKSALEYDEGSGSYQPKVIVGPTATKGSIKEIKEAPETEGEDAEDY